jgi:hypothetical protein
VQGRLNQDFNDLGRASNAIFYATGSEDKTALITDAVNAVEPGR